MCGGRFLRARVGGAAVGGPVGIRLAGAKHFAARLAVGAAQGFARPLQWGLHPVGVRIV